MFLTCAHSQPVTTCTLHLSHLSLSHLIDDVSGVFSVTPRDAGGLEIPGRNRVHNDDPLVRLDHPAVPSH